MRYQATAPNQHWAQPPQCSVLRGRRRCDLRQSLKQCSHRSALESAPKDLLTLAEDPEGKSKASLFGSAAESNAVLGARPHAQRNPKRSVAARIQEVRRERARAQQDDPINRNVCAHREGLPRTKYQRRR